jgi:5-formyltetrahydrofolate cyclo-ligase
MKVQLRRRLLAHRAALSKVEICQKSAAIAAHVCGMSRFQTSQTLMVYMALPYEVQTGAIVAAARQRQKRVVMPMIRDRQLVVVDCPAEMAQLRPGPYGILEPYGTYTVVQPEEIDCVLVPGVGFDTHGGRLGFGQGYYDRFLRQLPCTASYGGLAFSIQMVPHVPRLWHDVCVHFLVTEQGVQPCRHTLPQGRDPCVEAEQRRTP